ncbi:MAG TPA: DUF3866 family protein [Actinomycetota bacterium]|nr:DUF3866 family protein [Actinomycetota bacterium]
MIHIRRGVVRAVTGARPGAQELEVEVDGVSAPAISYPDLSGEVGPGDPVLLNATAFELGLGTGGLYFVIAVEGRESPSDAQPGHVMKARYTPVQTAVASVEETHAGLLEASEGLGQTPVVCAPLHSMLAPIAAGAKRAADARVVYVMTDGAALAGGFSRLVEQLRSSGLLDGWITCGQTFGGELEAVTIWTGLLAAKEVLDADVVVVADGPGNLGTDTTWGASALASGHALMAAATLQGRPIPALRVSFADERERHRGVSHHSLTILADVCKVDVNVPVPALDRAEQRIAVWDALRSRKLEEVHHLVEVDGRPAIEELRTRGIDVRTMGRGIGDDPAFFLAAGAAGILAGRMAAENRRWRQPTD